MFKFQKKVKRIYELLHHNFMHFCKGHFKAPNVEPSSISYMPQWSSIQSFSFHLCCFYWGLMGHFSPSCVAYVLLLVLGTKQAFALTNLSKRFGSLKNICFNVAMTLIHSYSNQMRTMKAPKF